MSEYLNINQLVASLQDDLGMSQDQDRFTLLRWIYQAIVEIQGLQVHKKVVRLTIKNLKVAKPNDLVTLDRIFLMTENSECSEPMYDDSVKQCCTSKTNCDRKLRVAEIPGYYTFSSNADVYPYAVLEYFQAPLDESGYPLIPIYCNEAIYNYTTYRYVARMRRMYQRAPSRYNPVAQAEVISAKREWQAAMADARARTIVKNAQEVAQIGNEVLYTSNSWPYEMTSQMNLWLYSKVK